MSTHMYRPRAGRIVGGVCVGLAEHTGWPVTGVRIGAAVSSLLGGLGIVLYVWLWIMAPERADEAPLRPLRDALTKPAALQDPPRADAAVADAAVADAARAAGGVSETGRSQQGRAGEPARTPGRPQRSGRSDRIPVAEILLGCCLIIAGVGLVLAQRGVRIPLEVIVPGIIMLAGIGLAWWQIADGGRPGRSPLIRMLGALALVAVGVLMFFVTANEPNLWTIVAAAIAVLAGVALALAPWLVRLNRDLITERAARAREAERSEIAAHLHDSVLQTLALIQQQSEPGTEVARLARSQERELREWLFRGADMSADPGQREPAASALRAHAAALEAEHAVRFELVAVGAAEVEVPEPLVAAAREAMLNAARHAGGDVTVYLEVTPAAFAIDVTDRGPGMGEAFGAGPGGPSGGESAPGAARSTAFDPARLPDGRMGVRDSILGRMARAGGTARILPGPGGTGTTVRLALPREALTAPETPRTQEPA